MNCRLGQVVVTCVLFAACSQPVAPDPVELFEQGDLHFNSEEYGLAIAAYTVAIEGADPELRSYVYNNRGFAYTLQQDYTRAVADFSAAIELRPDFLDAYLNRAGALYQLERYDDAIEDCAKALELSPGESGIYRNRAMVYRAIGDEALAEEDERKAAQLDSDADQEIE